MLIKALDISVYKFDILHSTMNECDSHFEGKTKSFATKNTTKCRTHQCYLHNRCGYRTTSPDCAVAKSMVNGL